MNTKYGELPTTKGKGLGASSLKRTLSALTLLVVGGFFMTVAHASATTFYVSQTATNGYVVGSNANNGTSKTTPKLTIGGANSAAVSGDTIIVNDGTYNEGVIYISKGLTINPENPNAVTITTPSSYVLDITPTSTSPVVLGQIILAGQGKAQYGMVVRDSSSTSAVTLNGTTISDTLNYAINGGAAAHINFSASNITVNCPNKQGGPAILLGPIAAGSVSITSSTFTLVSSSTSAGNLSVISLVGTTGVTASITNNNISTQSGTSGSLGAIDVRNIANAVITGNTLSITDIAGRLGVMDGIVVNAASTNTVDSSNPTIANNTITNTESGAGAHLILVGEDASGTSYAHNMVNNAFVYGNTVSGAASNKTTLHGIMLGNQSGGEVFKNKVDNVGIGLIAKGQTNGLFHDNLVTRVYGQYLRSKASTGTKFYNNTAIMSVGYADTGMMADQDLSTLIYSSNIDFKNNIIYSSSTVSYFVSVGSTSTAIFSNDLYYAPTSTSPFTYQGTSYASSSAWAAAKESTLVSSNPMFVSDGSNYALQYLSPAIDAAATTTITADLLGNPIYNAPDIGAYEYQPPHTIGTDKVDIGAGARIYDDGKFRDATTTSGVLADLTITPNGGAYSTFVGTSTRSSLLDISGITWVNSGTYHKAWTESSASTTLTNTVHTVGDLASSTSYNVLVDGVLGQNMTGASCTSGVCVSNAQGKITFTYTAFYSTHTFDVSASAPALSVATSTSLGFSAGFGSTATSSQSITITNGGAASTTLNWTASSTQTWLTFSSSSGSLAGSASSTISLIVNPSGLAVGTYTATTTITDPNASGSPKTLSVNLTITNGISTSLTAPASNAIVSSTVAVSATATAAVGISSVQFYLDGTPLGALQTVAPYSVSWNTNTSADGSHTLYALVTDTHANTASSSVVTVTVSNTTSVYYVANAGNDSCDGKSPVISTSGTCAWKTIAKVNAASFSAGNSILFNRGDTWLEQLTVPSSGASGNPVTFGAYGSGAAPVIDGQNVRPTDIDLNLQSYVTITGLTLTRASSTAAIRGYASGAIKNSYITINNVTVTSTQFEGIKFLGGDHITISSSTISNVTGDANVTGDGLYIGADSSNNPVTNVTITGNTFTGSFGRDAIALTGCTTCTVSNNTFTPTGLGVWLGTGSAVIDLEPNINQTVSGVSIYGNTFDYSTSPSSWAVNGSGTASGSTLSNIMVYSNTFNLHNMGTGAVGLKLGNDAGGTIVHNNTINNASSTGVQVYNGVNTAVYNNLISNTVNGAVFDFESGSIFAHHNIVNTMHAATYCGSAATCTIENNDFINYSGSYGIGNAGTSTVKNNIFSTTASSATNIQESPGAHGTYDYNLYYSPNIVSNAWLLYGNGFNTLAAWQATSTQDAHSLSANPLFVSSGTGNFHTQAGSPGIDAGANISSSTDYDGNYSYNTTDIGAYELPPSYVVGTNKIDIGGGARIYDDGTFDNMATTTTGTLADLTVTPAAGSYPTPPASVVRAPLLNITNITWVNSGTHEKAWTESSASSTLTNTIHTVGDLEANKYYSVAVDGVIGQNMSGTNCTNGVCQANAQGKITFTYTSHYSTHTFDIVETSAPVTSTPSSGGGGGGGWGGSVMPITAVSTSTATSTPVLTNAADIRALISVLTAQLNALLAQARTQGIIVPAATASIPTFSRNLQIYERAPEVKSLQQFLNGRGFIVSATGPGSPGNEIESFGLKTYLALKKFQASVGITPASGYFGPKTRAYINGLK